MLNVWHNRKENICIAGANISTRQAYASSTQTVNISDSL